MATQYPSTRVIITVLGELGFRHRKTVKQGVTRWSEYWVSPDLNGAGERISNHVGFYSNDARQRAWDLREEIERRSDELGGDWIVRKVRVGNYVDLTLTTDTRLYGDLTRWDDLPLGVQQDKKETRSA